MYRYRKTRTYNTYTKPSVYLYSMASLERVLDSSTSDEVMKSLSWKREVLNGKPLFEISGQAPSPSKDLIQLKITDKGIIWRKWKISIRGVTHGKAPTPSPTERVMDHQDFQYDDQLQAEIERSFGQSVLQQVKRILTGNHDNLSRLPESVLQYICLFLDLQSLTQLSMVNTHTREVCNSDKLWGQLYRVHQGSPSEEIVSLAGEVGWKTVFFMNKLQLQKEMSRRRRLISPQPQERSQQSPSTTFLTQ